MHPRGGLGREKCPSLARSAHHASENGLPLARYARHAFEKPCKQPFGNTPREDLARKGHFSRPSPPRGCMRRKNCHRLLPGNAPWRNLATDRHSGTHRARILPLPVRPRAHYGAILPPSDAGKRISRAFCHRRAPGNASRHNLAVAGSPKMHCGNTLPRQPPSRRLLDDILPRRPSTARACCEIAVVPRSRKTPPERSVGQFNTTR